MEDWSWWCVFGRTCPSRMKNSARRREECREWLCGASMWPRLVSYGAVLTDRCAGVVGVRRRADGRPMLNPGVVGVAGNDRDGSEKWGCVEIMVFDWYVCCVVCVCVCVCVCGYVCVLCAVHVSWS